MKTALLILALVLGLGLPARADPPPLGLNSAEPSSTVAIAAAKATNTVVSPNVGRVFMVLITAAGTNAMVCQDSTGNIVVQLPATTTVGQSYAFNMPYLTNLTCTGNAGNPGVTISIS